MMVFKRDLLFQGAIFRFHFKLQGCNWSSQTCICLGFHFCLWIRGIVSHQSWRLPPPSLGAPFPPSPIHGSARFATRNGRFDDGMIFHLGLHAVAVGFCWKVCKKNMCEKYIRIYVDIASDIYLEEVPNWALEFITFFMQDFLLYNLSRSTVTDWCSSSLVAGWRIMPLSI